LNALQSLLTISFNVLTRRQYKEKCCCKRLSTFSSSCVVCTKRILFHMKSQEHIEVSVVKILD
jgi:hypothetical protein